MNFVKYFSVIIFSLFLLNLVFAGAPGIPHQFYGTVTVNGAPANGASVVAKIEGVVHGSTTSVNGQYGFDPVFFVENPDGVVLDGRSIDFYLNGTKIASSIFSQGNLTELNLSLGEAPVIPPVDTGTGGAGGGGGGGGSGGLQVTFSEKCVNQDITVTVKLSNGKPASNAVVKVLVDRTEIVSGTTDDEGIYVFNLSEAKEYNLDVRKPGYSAKKIAFSLVDCSVEEEVAIEEEDVTDLETVLSCDNISCDDKNPCTKESCLDGACNYEQLTGLSCGEKGTCQAGVCVEPEPEKKVIPEVSSSTGFFGLGDLGGNIAVIVLVLVIAGIAFFFWKNKKEE